MSGDLARDGIPPAVELTAAVVVEIRRPQPRDGRLFHDDGTVLDFLQWQFDSGVLALSGYGGSGPGFYYGVFEARHADAVRAWLAGRGIEPDETGV